jgi:hypothetical protein
MATQKQIDGNVAVATAILKDCYGLKSLDTLIQNFEALTVVCKSLRSLLKEEGYTGVGLVVELFPKK